jgi:hypothetical protein
MPSVSNLAERFWSVAREMDSDIPPPTGDGQPDPAGVVKHVLKVLDAFDSGAQGKGVTVNTLSFLMLLRQQELAGDLLYASPEQARGEMVDERSLVFSVGVLLFEKLTGRHPFGAKDNPRRVARIQKGQMGSGVNYFPIIPAGLRMVLMRAMGPFPEERWENLKELRAKLEEFLAESSGEPLPGVRPKIIVKSMAHPVVTIQPKTTRTRDDEQTLVRTPANGTPSEGVKTITRAEAEAITKPAPEPEPTPPTPRFGPAAPFIWATFGAILASAGFLIAGRSAPPAPAPASASAPVPAPAPVPVPAPAPAPVTATVPDWKPAPASAPVPAPDPTPPPSTTFNPKNAGIRGLARSRDCFDAKLLASPAGVAFGVSLLFNPGDPTSKKIYFDRDDGFTGEQHRCLREALIGISADAPPTESTMVEYQLRIQGSNLEVRVRR